ncbi:MAG: hypothetical protein ABSD73_00210 [Candidatus Bathyarchaeia archaeon]
MPRFVKQHPEYKGKKFCRECMVKETAERQFREAQDGKTAFIQDDAQTVLQDRQKRLTIYTDVAAKFGYTFKQIEDAAYNRSAYSIPVQIHPATMIFEKAIATNKETNFLNCQYCKTRYDTNQYFKCPQCGSPAA